MSRVSSVSTFGRLAVLTLAAMLPTPQGGWSAADVGASSDIPAVEVACLITDYKRGGCDRSPTG
jgi:hypothetical protein